VAALAALASSDAERPAHAQDAGAAVVPHAEVGAGPLSSLEERPPSTAVAPAQLPTPRRRGRSLAPRRRWAFVVLGYRAAGGRGQGLGRRLLGVAAR